MKGSNAVGSPLTKKQKLWTSRHNEIHDLSLEDRESAYEFVRSSIPDELRATRRVWRGIDLGDRLFSGFEISGNLDLSPAQKCIGDTPVSIRFQFFYSMSLVFQL